MNLYKAIVEKCAKLKHTYFHKFKSSDPSLWLYSWSHWTLYSSQSEIIFLFVSL